MKNSKIMPFLLSLAGLFTVQGLFGGLEQAVGQGCLGFSGVTKKAYSFGAPETDTTTGIGLSFYNKSGTTAYISVKNHSIAASGTAERWLSKLTETEWTVTVPDGGMADFDLDVSKPTTLKVLRTCTDRKCDLNRSNTIAEYTFTPGKKMYVSWSSDKGLYPQTGPSMGGLIKLGITDMCYDKSGNVTQADIKQEYPKLKK